MKILLIADPHGPGDEGARNVSKNVLAGLQTSNHVLCVKAKNIPKAIFTIWKFRPDIIHSIHGPSLSTIYLLRMLKFLLPRALYFVSLTQPDPTLLRSKIPASSRFSFITFLSQEKEFEDALIARHSVISVPNGVDTSYFCHEETGLPDELKAIIPEGKRLLLHVGHIKRSRGLEVMAALNNEPGWHSVIIGSTRFDAEPDCLKMLQDAGCTVYQGFIKDLPALYSAVDAYVFPVTAVDGSIAMPLTILEALACGCAVISSPFKAIPRFIKPGQGIYYFNNINEARDSLNKISDCKPEEIEKLVQDYSWKSVCNQLIDIYQSKY